MQERKYLGHNVKKAEVQIMCFIKACRFVLPVKSHESLAGFCTLVIRIAANVGTGRASYCVTAAISFANTSIFLIASLEFLHMRDERSMTGHIMHIMVLSYNHDPSDNVIGACERFPEYEAV